MKAEPRVRYSGDMDRVRVELPAELMETANLDVRRISQETAQLIALELFREQRVSLGRAAELCHTPLSGFMDFVAKHRVSPIRYYRAELEEDRDVFAELGLWRSSPIPHLSSFWRRSASFLFSNSYSES